MINISKFLGFWLKLFLKYFIPVCCGFLFSQSALAEEYKFKFHHFLGANSFWQTEILQPWVDNIEKNSNGRISIEIFPSMTLGGRPPELVQQARDGVVDPLQQSPGPLAVQGGRNARSPSPHRHPDRKKGM